MACSGLGLSFQFLARDWHRVTARHQIRAARPGVRDRPWPWLQKKNSHKDKGSETRGVIIGKKSYSMCGQFGKLGERPLCPHGSLHHFYVCRSLNHLYGAFLPGLLLACHFEICLVQSPYQVCLRVSHVSSSLSQDGFSWSCGSLASRASLPFWPPSSMYSQEVSWLWEEELWTGLSSVCAGAQPPALLFA